MNVQPSPTADYADGRECALRCGGRSRKCAQLLGDPGQATVVQRVKLSPKRGSMCLGRGGCSK